MVVMVIAAIAEKYVLQEVEKEKNNGINNFIPLRFAEGYFIIANTLNSGIKGQFNPRTGKIYISSEIKSTEMLSIALHEAGHSIKISAPNEWRELEKFVVNYLTSQNKNVSRMIEKQMEVYRASGQILINDTALEEIVCNTLMSLASDEKALQTAIKSTDKSALQKIASAIKKIVAKIKSWLSDRNAISAEAYKPFMNDVNALMTLAEKFEKAAESGRGVKVEQKNNTGDNSDVKNSIRDTKDIAWGEQINNYFLKNGLIKHSDTLVVEKNTPDYLLSYMDNLPLALPISVISKAQNKKDISHSVNDSNIKRIQNGISNSIATIYNKGRNSVLFITDIKQGEYPLVVAFEINSVFYGDSVHKCTSIHLRTNLEAYLSNLKGTTVFIKNKNELNALCREVNILDRLQKNNKLIDISLSQGIEDVNGETRSDLRFAIDDEYGMFDDLLEGETEEQKAERWHEEFDNYLKYNPEQALMMTYNASAKTLHLRNLT